MTIEGESYFAIFELNFHRSHLKIGTVHLGSTFYFFWQAFIQKILVFNKSYIFESD